MSAFWYKWFKETVIDAGVAPMYIMFIYFVFVTRIGPKFMRARKPFSIRPLILAYNALQVCCCLVLIYLVGAIPLKEQLTCMEVLTGDAFRNQYLPPLGWMYYMLKYLDLADTVFFVLRKKQQHVTPLHLFHHVSMVFATWLGVKYYPSGVLAIAPYINSWVHAAMYAYYFCALYFGKVPLAWKKLITTIQLAQFVLGTTVFIIHLLNPWCGFPKPILLPIILHGLTFIYMFADFYHQTYLRTTRR